MAPFDEALQPSSGRPAEDPLPLPAKELLAAARLRQGQRLLDLNCGFGAVFFAAFEALGGQGAFFAADLLGGISPEFTRALEERRGHPGFSSIHWVQAKAGRIPLPDSSLDRVFLVQGLSALAQRETMLKEARRLLGPGGLLCLAGPRPGADASAAARDESEAVAQLGGAGFSLCVSHAQVPRHWCLAAGKR